MIHPYATLDYARSLPHLGDVFPVPEWRTAVLSRPIDASHRDATGTYPLAVLSTDADLEGGLQRLRRAGFVSVSLVLDEAHRPALAALEEAFDIVRPFKTHYLVDRAAGEAHPSKAHRYMVRRALETLRIEVFPLRSYLAQWIELYGYLSQRHGLRGVHELPRQHHGMLADMPEATAIGAFADEGLLAAHIWVEVDGQVHSHLAASSEEGYRLGAAYAVNDASIKFFSAAKVINLGGGAGYVDDPTDGLARFKRGFSNATANAYLCGKVLDAEAYGELTVAAGASGSAFFPAYREPTRRTAVTS